MKKLISIISLGIISILCYSQDFLNNSNYVYGIGYTDSAAVVSLSMSIGVHVVGETKYVLQEKNNIASRSFNKENSISYSRFLSDTKPYYDKDNNLYYRYINKAEYIKKHYELCKKYERIGDSLDITPIKHKINLVLGYYYKAYSEISSEIFITLSEKTYESYANRLKSKAKIIYYSGDYGDLWIDSKAFKGYWICTNYSPKTVGNPCCLFAFEYVNGNKWTLPSCFSYENDVRKNISLPNDGIFFDKSFVYSSTNDITYRIIYEDENGKINVPKSWYFCYFKIINAKNIT